MDDKPSVKGAWLRHVTHFFKRNSGLRKIEPRQAAHA